MVITSSYSLDFFCFFASISIALQASLFVFVLSLAGFAFLPNPKNSSYSLVFERAVEGMFIFAAFSWFAWKSGLNLFTSGWVFFFLIAALLFIRFFSNFKSIESVKKLIIKFLLFFRKPFLVYILMAFFVALLWMPFTTPMSTKIMTRFGGDIFSWALMANHLFGVSDLSYIRGNGIFIDMIKDCFGAYSVIGLPSLIGGLPLENISLIVISQCALLGCLMCSLLDLTFNKKINFCFLITLLFLSNPLWVYIFQNVFFSQIISTVGLFYALLVVSKAVDSDIKITISTLSVFFFISTSFFSIMYPALAPEHSLLVLFFLMLSLLIRSMMKGEKLALIIKKQTTLLLSFVVSLAFSIVVFYDFWLHTFYRSFGVTQQKAGWSLPLLDALTLLGISNPRGFYNTFLSSVIGYLIITVIVLILGWFLTRQKSINEFESHSREALKRAGYISYVLLILAYLIIYELLGDSYQQWKFASYYPLTFSIFILGIFSEGINSWFNFNNQSRFISRIALLGIFSSMIVFNLYANAKNSMFVLSKDVENLASINNIYGIETIYLDLAPWHETMAAMNYINQKKIVPISISPAPTNKLDLDQISLKSPLLTNQLGCTKIPNVDSSEIVTNRLFLISKLPGRLRKKLKFNSVNADACKYINNVELTKGFGTPEIWGTWSAGTSAVARIYYNEIDLDNKQDILVKFSLSAFIVPPKVNSQIITAKVGNSIQTWNFSSNGPHFIRLVIPKEILNKEGFVDIDFYFPNATRPKDIDKTTGDGRQIAIGFLDAEII